MADQDFVDRVLEEEATAVAGAIVDAAEEDGAAALVDVQPRCPCCDAAGVACGCAFAVGSVGPSPRCVLHGPTPILSRLVARRLAAQRGEEMPTFAHAEPAPGNLHRFRRNDTLGRGWICEVCGEAEFDANMLHERRDCR